MNNIIDLSELEIALETEQDTLCKPVFFWKKGTPVSEVRQWIQSTREHERQTYDLYKIEGLKI
jgi:hypothetical protein